MENVKKIAELLNIKNSQVEKVLELTAEGNTVPFIARYRKEATGSLDEVEIKKIILIFYINYIVGFMEADFVGQL